MLVVLADTTQFGKVFHVFTILLVKPNFRIDHILLETSQVSDRYQTRHVERVQALVDISRSALCCHSNETHAPIANTPNSAQLEGTPYHSPSFIRVRAVVWECGEGQTHTDRQTHGRS